MAGNINQCVYGEAAYVSDISAGGVYLARMEAEEEENILAIAFIIMTFMA